MVTRTHVKETAPDRWGRIRMVTYGYEPEGIFRHGPAGDGLPAGFRRGQVFFCEVRPELGVEVATHDEARELAWPTLSDEGRANGIEQMTWILNETGIYGQAREYAEAALAWLKAGR